MKKNIKFHTWDFIIVSIIHILCIPALLIIPSTCPAQELFLEKEPMPTARDGLCTAVIDGKIYAVGGWKDETDYLSNVEVYDPATDDWDTTRTPMPTARCAMGCTGVDGKIYVIGGLNDSSLSTVEVYDPVSDTWEEKTDMPGPRGFVAARAVNGKIYVIGGSKLNTTIWSGLNTVEEYDPATDTWTKKKNMPTARWCPGSCVVDGKIYIIGGNIGFPDISNAAEVYDPATDTWDTTKTDMPTSRYAIATCFVNGKIFAFGGWHLCSASYPMYKIVEEYNVNMDKWVRKSDMPFKIGLMSAETLNGTIYLIGGTDRQHTFHSIDNTFEYDPTLDVTGVKDLFTRHPSQFSLHQNYPNPFNPETTIEYVVKEPCQVNLIVYNLKGQIVEEFINFYQQTGIYSININMQNVPSGIYFYKIEMGDFKAVKKMAKIE